MDIIRINLTATSKEIESHIIKANNSLDLMEVIWVQITLLLLINHLIRASLVCKEDSQETVVDNITIKVILGSHHRATIKVEMI